MLKKVKSALRAIREGRSRDLLDIVRERWGSEVLSYGLRRDLSVPHNAPDARIAVSVRPLRGDDVPRILDPHEPGITEEDRNEIQTRLQIVEADIHTCYVAVTAGDAPCYMQWLIGPEENSKVQAYYKGIFPRVKQNEVLLEGAFTPVAFRGKGIMAHAMSKLAECGLDMGAHYAITFVPQENIASLRGCLRAGFTPHMMRRVKWRYFRKQVTFALLPDGTPFPFD